eukprot:280860-Pyramimonas_sp.AAC.1
MFVELAKVKEHAARGLPFGQPSLSRGGMFPDHVGRSAKLPSGPVPPGVRPRAADSGPKP